MTGQGVLSGVRPNSGHMTTNGQRDKEMTDAYVVSSSAPAVQRSRALRAAALFANSTMPFPVGRPRSSVTTMDLSTGPN